METLLPHVVLESIIFHAQGSSVGTISLYTAFVITLSLTRCSHRFHGFYFESADISIYRTIRISKPLLGVENLSVVTPAGSAGFVRHVPRIFSPPETILSRLKHAFRILAAHAMAHVQEPEGVLPLRLEATMCHMLLVVYSYPRV